MASKELERFQRQVDEFVVSLTEDQLVTFTAAVSLRFLRGVVLKTRVDTGRARGGWQASVGSPASGEGALDKSGSQTISRAESELSGLRPFQNVFVTNNVPYISFLNDGTDRFHGDKMVERTLAELSTIFP